MSLQCFPPTLLWLIRSLYHILLNAAHQNGNNNTEPVIRNGITNGITNGVIRGNGQSINDADEMCDNDRQSEVTACCIDLVIVQLLCNALVTPEMHGVCDAPVSHIARYNLMQVCQYILLKC